MPRLSLPIQVTLHVKQRTDSMLSKETEPFISVNQSIKFNKLD